MAKKAGSAAKKRTSQHKPKGTALGIAKRHYGGNQGGRRDRLRRLEEDALRKK